MPDLIPVDSAVDLDRIGIGNTWDFGPFEIRYQFHPGSQVQSDVFAFSSNQVIEQKLKEYRFAWRVDRPNPGGLVALSQGLTVAPSVCGADFTLQTTSSTFKCDC